MKNVSVITFVLATAELCGHVAVIRYCGTAVNEFVFSIKVYKRRTQIVFSVLRGVI
jgi:hypothetical protein